MAEYGSIYYGSTPDDSNAVTAHQVLLKVADEVGETHSGFIETVTTPTEFICPGISPGPGTNFKYALATIEGGGITTVTAYYADIDTIVISSGFTPTAATGNVLTVALWDANKKGQLQRAINQAILASYPHWYREVVLDLNNNVMADGLTTFTMQGLSSSSFEYSLPSDVSTLSRVGLQSHTTSPPIWFPPLNLWRVTGQAGSLKVRFSNLTTFVGDNAGTTLCFWYEAREPQFSTFANTETTQLPLDYFTVAAEIYSRRIANQDNVLTQQYLQFETSRVLGRLGMIRKPLPRGPRYSWN